MDLSRKPAAVILPIVLAAVCLAMCLICELSKAGPYASKGVGVPLDDSWIHFIYAKSLGTTLRLDYNPGQSESGFTSLLWVILLAPGLAAGIPPAFFAKILGAAALAGCVLVCFFILKKRILRTAAFAAGLILALDPILAFAAMSGMETVPYALAMLLAAWALLERRYARLGWALAACAVMRPDGAIMVGLVCIAVALEKILPRERKTGAPTGADLLMMIGLPLIAAAAWGVYDYAATGRWLPASYYVRAGGALPAVFDRAAFENVRQSLAATFPGLLGIGAIFFLAGGVAEILRSKERLRFLPILLLPPALTILMGGEVLTVVGGTFIGNRYLAPAFPLLVLLTALGAQFYGVMIRKLCRRENDTMVFLEPVLSLLLIFALLGLPSHLLARIESSSRRFATNCRDIREMQEAFGEWVRKNTPPEAAVCTFDAGAIRYLGERKTVDILGLNTAGFPPQDPAAVLRECAYLITYPKYSGELLAKLAPEEVFRIDLPENTVSADRLMAAYDLKHSN